MTSAVVGALRVNLGADTSAFDQGLTNARTKLTAFGAAVKTGFALAAGAAVVAVGKMGVAVHDSINAADQMDEAAQRIGIGTEELSRLAYAAKITGVEFSSMETSLSRLSRNMVSAANGSESAQKKFAQFGVEIKNADGSLKSTSDVMKAIADRMASMPDGAEKTAMAMELMGRSGADMILMLNGGSKALGDLMVEAESFGQVFTAEMGANAGKFNENIDRLIGLSGSLAAKIATAILPAMTAFTDWLIDVIPRIGIFVNETMASFVAAWDGITTKVSEVSARIQQFANDIIGWFAALPARMLEIGGQIIDGLWQGITAKWDAFLTDMQAKAASLLDTFTGFFQIQSPSRVMHEVGENIVEGLNQGMQSMQAETDATATEIGGTLTDSFSDLASSIGSQFTSAFSSIIDGTKSAKEAFADLASSIAQMFLNRALQGIFDQIFGMIGGAFGGSAGPLNLAQFTPGVSIGIRICDCCEWRCASGLVLPITIAILQRGSPRPEDHHLRPLIT